jgi:YHS domain-containing protein
MILRLILAAVILFILYRMIKRFFGIGSKKASPIKGQKMADTAMEDLVEDPVCHTYLPISKAIVWEENDGKRYFCSEECLKEYRQSKGKR